MPDYQTKRLQFIQAGLQHQTRPSDQILTVLQPTPIEGNPTTLQSLIGMLEGSVPEVEIQPKEYIPKKGQLVKEQRLQKMYGMGYELIAKMGYKIDKGLGKKQDGILQPLPQLFKNKFQGSPELPPSSDDQKPLSKIKRTHQRKSNVLIQLGLDQRQARTAIEDEGINREMQQYSNIQDQLIVTEHELQQTLNQTNSLQQSIKQLLELQERLKQDCSLEALAALTPYLSQYYEEIQFLGLCQTVLSRVAVELWSLQALLDIICFFCQQQQQQGAQSLAQSVLGGLQEWGLPELCFFIVQLNELTPSTVRSFLQNTIIPPLSLHLPLNPQFLHYIVLVKDIGDWSTFFTSLAKNLLSQPLHDIELFRVCIDILPPELGLRVLYPKLLHLGLSVNIFKSTINQASLQLLAYYCQLLPAKSRLALLDSSLLSRIEGSVEQVIAEHGREKGRKWVGKWEKTLEEVGRSSLEWFASLRDQFELD